MADCIKAMSTRNNFWIAVENVLLFAFEEPIYVFRSLGHVRENLTESDAYLKLLLQISVEGTNREFTER